MATEYGINQQVRGTTAEWAANDIVLLDGEIGVEKMADGTRDIKIGDGTHRWSELPYFVGVTSGAASAGFHNSIYRGKQIGTSVSAAQWASIAAGTFDDMFVGDYWTINGVNWRIGGFNYWINVGYSTTPHIVIVPDSVLAAAQMNSTATTAGAYYNSDFRTGANGNTGRADAITAVNSAFGSSHILTYKDYLHSAVTNGHPSGVEWADCTVELMNEEMVYGGHIFAPVTTGAELFTNHTTSKSQLPLFQHEHSLISNMLNWWLRSVAQGGSFAFVNENGPANYALANSNFYIRPAFGIR